MIACRSFASVIWGTQKSTKALKNKCRRETYFWSPLNKNDKYKIVNI
jgi:hypothetical protein